MLDILFFCHIYTRSSAVDAIGVYPVLVNNGKRNCI